MKRPGNQHVPVGISDLRPLLWPLMTAIALVLPVVVARTGHLDHQPAVSMGPAEVWLETRGSRELALIDGPSASFVVGASIPAPGLRMAQADGTAYGLDRTRGVLHRISGITHEPDRLSVEGVNPDTVGQIASGPGLYVFPTSDGRLARAVTHDARADLVPGPKLPARYQIAATGAFPAVVDLDRGTVTWYDDGQKRAQARIGQSLSDGLQVAGDESNGRIYLVDPLDGVVTSCIDTHSTCTRTRTSPSVAGLSGTPVVAAGRLLLTDPVKGRIRSVDMKNGSVSSLPVFGRGTEFELSQQHGYAFANVPAGRQAAVIAPDNTVTLVAKYRLNPEAGEPSSPARSDPPAPSAPEATATATPSSSVRPTTRPSSTAQPSRSSEHGEPASPDDAGPSGPLPPGAGPTGTGPTPGQTTDNVPQGPGGPGGTGGPNGPDGPSGPAGPSVPSGPSTSDDSPGQPISPGNVGLSVRPGNPNPTAIFDVRTEPPAGESYFLVVFWPGHGYFVHAEIPGSPGSGSREMVFSATAESGPRRVQVFSAGGADADRLRENLGSDRENRRGLESPGGEPASVSVGFDVRRTSPTTTDPRPTSTTSSPSTTSRPPSPSSSTTTTTTMSTTTTTTTSTTTTSTTTTTTARPPAESPTPGPTQSGPNPGGQG